MKNVFLALTLVLSVSASMFADIRIKSRFIIRSIVAPEQSRTQELNFDLKFKGAGDCCTTLVGTDGEFKTRHAILSVSDEGVVLVITWFEKNSDGEYEVISTTVMSIFWGQEAVACIEEETDNIDDALFIAITAYKDIDGASERNSNVVESNVADTGNSVSEEVIVAEEVMAGQGEVVREQGEETVSSK